MLGWDQASKATTISLKSQHQITSETLLLTDARGFPHLTRPKIQPKSSTGLQGGPAPLTTWYMAKPLELPPAFVGYGRKVSPPPWYENRAPGWPSSQGVSTSDETKNSAKIEYFREVQLP